MLVGRESPVQQLIRAILGQRPSAVIGEAGIGKTSVVKAALDAVGGRHAVGSGLRMLSWLPYLPIANALRTHVPNGAHSDVAFFVKRRLSGAALVIDDLHWADSDTLRIVPYLARATPLVVSVRTGERTTGRAMEVVADSAMEIIELGPLSASEAETLVHSRNPTLTPEEVQTVLQGGGGNPFFLEEIAKSGSPSATLDRLVARKIEECSPSAREAMAMLTLLGRPTPKDLFREAADELLEVGLVSISEEGVTIRHGLLSEAVMRAIPLSQRSRLHSRLARLVPEPGESARHHGLAGEHKQARQKALEAAAQTQQPGEKARHLAVAASSSRGTAADRLRLQASASLLQAGEFKQAGEIARLVSANDNEVQAEALLYQARSAYFLGAGDLALDLVRAGLALTGSTATPSSLRLRIEEQRILGTSHRNPSVALVEANKVWGLSRAIGTEEVRARTMLALQHLECGSFGWYGHFNALLTQARQADDFETECSAARGLVEGHLLMGNPKSAAGLAAEMRDRTASLGFRGWELDFQSLLAAARLQHEGAWQEVIQECTRLMRQPLPLTTRARTRLTLGLALADTGSPREAITVLQVTEVPGAHSTHQAWAIAEAMWLSADPQAAVKSADRCAVAANPGSPLKMHAKLTSLWASFDMGQKRKPSVPIAPLISLQGGTTEAAALTCLSSPTHRLEAEELFVAAAAQWSGYNARSQMRCLWAAGEAARSAGAPERAAKRLAEVESQATKYGLHPLLSRVHRSMRLAGVRPRVAERTQDGDLSERERAVMRLVAEGCSSAEIAARLCVARSTVESQVRSSMHKLGAKTRQQAALMAREEE